MSASQIPNLLSLRGGSRGGRARARGRGGGGAHASSAGSGPARDAVIQGTDTDAAVSRLSCVELGYLDDPYAQFFAMNGSGIVTRRLPIINRGTYTRTMALDRLIEAFLGDSSESPAARQIISLGAGTDTRAFRLWAQPGPRTANLVYHEIDFPTTATKKLHTVQAIPPLRAILPNATPQSEASWSAAPPSGGEYWCHGLDLRQLAEPSDKSPLPGMRADIPTLLLSECCLCYLEAAETRAILQWFADRISDLGTVIYEPIRPSDAFGKMMIANLAARHIRMPTLEAYGEPADQEARLQSAGYEHARATTIEDVWDQWVPAQEKERVDGLEGLDEVEEWKLLAGHYVVAWGWKGRGFTNWDAGG